jgi:hypothetical protein
MNSITRLIRKIGVSKDSIGIIPARLAFQKNSESLSNLYWLGTVPSGMIGCGYGIMKGLDDFKTKSIENRIMYTSMMGLIGFGGGVSMWMLWPLTITTGVSTIIYDKYNEKN